MCRRSSCRSRSANRPARSSSVPGSASVRRTEPAISSRFSISVRRCGPDVRRPARSASGTASSGDHASMRVHAVPPRLDVDVGRRRRRQHVAAVDADARRVADERHAARRVEIADVMRRMARRVGDLERPAAGVDPLAALSATSDVRAAPARTRPTADPCRRRTAAWRCRAASSDRPCAARRARGRTPDVRMLRARSCRWRRRDRGGCASAGCGGRRPSGSPARCSPSSSVADTWSARDRRARRRRAPGSTPVAIACGRPRNCRSTHEQSPCDRTRHWIERIILTRFMDWPVSCSHGCWRVCERQIIGPAQIQCTC